MQQRVTIAPLREDATIVGLIITIEDVTARMEDERLTSKEAESRLARRERDWRKRKAQLDSVAAAIILQDYLDRHGG